MKFKLFLFICFIGHFTLNAQIHKYTIVNHAWNSDSLGNHRAVVQFMGTGKIAHVKINWRRRDEHPELKGIIIQNASGKTMQTVGTDKLTRESADIYFEPSGAGQYYVYYLPYKNEGRSNYPKGVYLKPQNNTNLLNDAKNTPINTNVVEIQSVDAFNSFYPMEVIATTKETDALKAKYHSDAFLVFPENRMYPIKMQKNLPYRWIQKGVSTSFSDVASKGENYAFQLGVYALTELKDVKITFGDLKSSTGKTIPAKFINCLNSDGISYDNKSLKEVVNVAKGNIQAMWLTLNIPKSTSVGLYTGKFTVKANGKTKIVDVKIAVGNEVLADAGVGTPIKQTRLTWLNSTLAQENTVVAPYTALKVEGNVISLLGRKFEINTDGFPKQIQTFFNSEMTGYTDKPNNLLAEPIHFHFYNTPKLRKNLRQVIFK